MDYDNTTDWVKRGDQMKDYRTNPDRIDPEHPLAKAARDVNDRTEAKGLDGMVADLGLGVSVAQLAYLAEQRALRAFSARYLGYNMQRLNSVRARLKEAA